MGNYACGGGSAYSNAHLRCQLEEMGSLTRLQIAPVYDHITTLLQDAHSCVHALLSGALPLSPLERILQKPAAD